MTALPLALTMGEPAGIGGEIAADAWRALHATGPVFVLLDDADRIRALPNAPPVAVVAGPEEAAASFPTALPILHRPLPLPTVPGAPNPAHAPAVLGAIAEATRLAMAGRVAAVVTNPIQKASLTAAGFPHPGHTEYLAELTAGGPPVMMLACEGLRTIPVTIHEPLRTAIARLTTAMILDVALVTAAALTRDFGIVAPRLAIAGLNPHAGEAGTLGSEDAEIVAPAVAQLQARGIAATGPWPPDTMFTPTARTRYDAAICMYHDQALIPVKTLDMAGGVNVTLNLPVIRTSPDHGTALDLAGTGRADPASLIAALRMAATIAAHHRRP
ncbi:4-hydroxythreonine-4-phosphate dehydrogenase PdxA [Humitalea sp. 24SJ18S-53]|uniref:4-hydroxythreonine-4-phosphate dehydrogenase PdxA n=1 Tax=Humitalea sp. 24SJ18S-53 TaxID=3422307 RepID=UPI003D66A9F4